MESDGTSVTDVAPMIASSDNGTHSVRKLIVVRLF